MKTLEINDLGKIYLENFPKITIKEVLLKARKRLFEELLKIELDGIETIKTKANYGGERIWFKCPKCNQKVFTLYDIKGEFKCRKCSGLKYKKQRINRMLESKI